MNIFATFRRRHDARRTYADLLKLDDHLLADIGVRRADLLSLMGDPRAAHRRATRDHE